MEKELVVVKVKFSKATEQAKLQGIASWLGYRPNVYSFSLPSGYSCPFALDCLSKANKVTGQITDGKQTLYRCFSATTEAYAKHARDQRWHNFDILRHLDYQSMVQVLNASLPTNCDICRVHVGGDFFNQKYFDAWLQVARLNPETIFYAYTKSAPYWIERINSIPANFVLTASRGGRYDNLIDEHNLKVAEVVFSLEEAKQKNLPIDHDEYYAINNAGNFGLLIHGTQPKNSRANLAIKDLKNNGVKYAYTAKRVSRLAR
jgi:hypothetical protein